MTRGMASLASLQPVSPLGAVTTWKPCLARNRRVRSSVAGSSSITRIVSAPDSAVGSLAFGFVAGICAGFSLTTAGRSTVNVVPSPTTLSIVMSPPIIWQNFFEMARPNPVPPYFRVVDESAWVNSSKTFSICSGVMPIPVSRTDQR